MRRCDGGGSDLGTNADGDDYEEAEPADGLPTPDEGHQNYADNRQCRKPISGEHLKVEPGVGEEAGTAEAGQAELTVLEYNDE